ncbi:ATP-binding protein [Limnohabitans sp. DM1]|uniref:ATP-binding protein n=1 Tax=Limnohabitans sp. DM1 TaxID=1597955 RepID=UPI000B7CEF54|nr:ATP-binding protein [Limnohabitans sp. DM1]
MDNIIKRVFNGAFFMRIGGSSLVANAQLSKRKLLAIYLLAVGLTSLLFYLIPPGYYDRNANLVVSIIMVVLMLFASQRKFYTVLVHLVTLFSLLLITYIASQSGGVNSTSIVWLNVLAVPVLLLLGPAVTVVWIAIILLTIFALFLATLNGWVGSQAHITQQAVPWAVMNNMLAIANLMLGVRLYEHLHEEQLKQLHQRNEELKATHEALLQAQAHKDEFVAAVGHELRTPMNAILGFNGVLRQELAEQPDQVEVVDHIRRSTMHLLQVVNDILDFSQLQAGKFLLHEVDFELSALLQEALQTHQQQALEKGIGWSGHLDPQLPQYIHADRQRLLQILRNLLGNALKFTAKGTVQLRMIAHQDQLRCEVMDTGRGIAPSQQTHIFSRFGQADVQTIRTYGGTGLGLSISEKLVTLQGGQIGVTSQPGQGATFWFEVPLNSAKAMPVPTADSLPPPEEALRILVVDDNSMNLMVARLQLQKCWPKAHIVTAESAAQALQLLDEQGFDVALIDMIMPDMDGMALTHQIRHQFPAMTAHMPIIALTANTNPVDRQRCLDAGMDDVLAKPMDLSTLMDSVSRHIARARG